MEVLQINVYSLVFLFGIIQDNYVLGSNCQQAEPVVNICTDDSMEVKTSLHIDTQNVPLYQKSYCECIISPPEVEGRFKFSFTYTDNAVPRNMIFKMNGITLDSVTNHYTTRAIEQKLSLYTTDNYTKEESCLRVSKDKNSSFQIFCKRTSFTPTSNRKSTLKEPEISTRPEQTASDSIVQKDTEDTVETIFIIIVVPTVMSASLILKATVMCIVYFKRKRLEKQPSMTVSYQNRTRSMAEPNDDQDRGQENNNAAVSERDQEISIIEYERLHKYGNNKPAGDMYEQLNTDRERDQEISTTEYEILHTYLNNKLAGQMYEQLNTDINDNKGKPGNNRVQRSN